MNIYNQIFAYKFKTKTYSKIYHIKKMLKYIDYVIKYKCRVYYRKESFMLEKKLIKLIEKSNKIRQQGVKNNSLDYYNDTYTELSNFITKKLSSTIFKKRNAKIIASHFDEILPYIVASNINILLLNAHLLVEQPNFKERFGQGLIKYPYKDEINEIFNNIWFCLNGESNKFDEFMDSNILKNISIMEYNKNFYQDILNKLNEEKQKELLNLLAKNKCDISYNMIEYKGNNKQIIYENLPLFIENAKNLYNLMDFVKDDPAALKQVKDYIDKNEEKAIESIFCETANLRRMKDPTLKEIIKLIILDVMKNENAKFSDITYNSGGFSRVLLIGEKVIKIGDRMTKTFPNNPYIISPLLRKKFDFNGESCFVEVTERVDTNTPPSHEELYQLYKHLRDLNLVWTDIKGANVGRLKRKNVIHWRENIEPTDNILDLNEKRGEKVLEEGDLVILDADFIYDEKDKNINKVNNKALIDEFETRYQKEDKPVNLSLDKSNPLVKNNPVNNIVEQIDELVNPQLSESGITKVGRSR